MYISNCLKSLILTILITDEDLSRDDDTIYSMKYSFLVKMNNYLTKVKIKRNGNINHLYFVRWFHTRLFLRHPLLAPPLHFLKSLCPLTSVSLHSPLDSTTPTLTQISPALIQPTNLSWFKQISKR